MGQDRVELDSNHLTCHQTTEIAKGLKVDVALRKEATWQGETHDMHMA